MFICNHCPFVVLLKDKIVEVCRSYADRGVAAVAISSNSIKTHPQDGPEHMAEEAKKLGESPSHCPKVPLLCHWSSLYLHDCNNFSEAMESQYMTIRAQVTLSPTYTMNPRKLPSSTWQLAHQNSTYSTPIKNWYTMVSLMMRGQEKVYRSQACHLHLFALFKYGSSAT